MAGYVDRISKPPRTLTDKEHLALLKAAGEHARGFRDHVLLSLALGTALREHELLALTVGDVYQVDGAPRRRFPLRQYKGSKRAPTDRAPPPHQEAIVPDDAIYKLRKFFAWKRLQGEPLDPAAPLFLSRFNKRLSPRRFRSLFKEWQQRAGFDRFFTVHELRHTALTHLWRRTKDLKMVQKLARHSSARTTEIYTHVDDEDFLAEVRKQPC